MLYLFVMRDVVNCCIRIVSVLNSKMAAENARVLVQDITAEVANVNSNKKETKAKARQYEIEIMLFYL